MGRKLAPVTDDGPLMDGRQAPHSVPQDGAGPEFFAALREARILVNAEQQRRLLASSDPLSAIARARDLGIGPGMLGNEDLEQMLDATVITNRGPSQPALGRVIAPMAPPPLTNPALVNGMPHWRPEDFPMDATDASIELMVHYDITGNSVTEGRMQDIQACFNDRLDRLGRMIREQLPGRPKPIGQIAREHRMHQGYENMVAAIGMVMDAKHTKNGHLIFELEDRSGAMKCLLTSKQGENLNHQRIIEAGLMPDDVIGVTVSSSQSGDIFYVDDLFFPSHKRRTKAHAEEGVSVAFLSDIHVGSKTFLEAQWHKMVAWFHEHPLARTIKYLILSGDCVDGVGIYPGQDKELAIPDLFDQYTRFAELLHLLPDWVECIMLPGNHDAVRPAEPQPTFEPTIQQDYNTTTFVGNPCDFSLHGVRLLSYHGKSIDDFVATLRTVTYADPVEAMREMLRRRHLAPQWGGKTPLSPEPEDGLIIREVPDIFVTGHVHGHACLDHRGTTLVCSSTWQDQTSYQRMLGFQPRPCMLTVVNLGTPATASIPFA